jgi:hypothetical protein
MSLWHLGGRDPEPLQRPRLAGAITGAGAAVVAAILVWTTDSVALPARAIGLSETWLMALSMSGLTVAGALYGAAFLRAANDRRGGWLFGLGWGFLTWALGPITFCQWLLGKPISAGGHAAILLLAHLLWGLVLGLCFPLVQGRIEMKVDKAPSPRTKSMRRNNPSEQAPRDYRVQADRSPAEDVTGARSRS